jgi:hypothetical protein
MRKRLLFLACGFGLLLVAGSAMAVPPCSYVNGTNCGGECALYGQSCISWSVGSCTSGSASYVFHCSGTNISGSCSCGGGGGCFLPGTQISLADGGTKPIESIEAGDLVLAWDEASGEMKPDAVRGVHPPIAADAYLIVNDRLRFTDTHPVLLDDAWVKAGELKVGDTLTAADGNPVVIETIRRVAGPVTVYNFEVNPLGTYVANGIVVHNKVIPKEWEPDEP